MRVALVMNGGVSLAIWMGGVTHELDRVRRAGFPELATLSPPADRWSGLLDALGVRVTVDVIAGASAGGLNGAVLGAAVARRRALPALRELWLRLGDLREKLLIDEDERDPDLRATPSVLNGAFFQAELESVFAQLPAGPPSPAPSDDGADDAAPTAITVFLTGTSLQGAAGSYRDEAGSVFRHKEHRVRFCFRREPGPAYGPDGRPRAPHDAFATAEANRQLARAARATASFPGAFEPVFCPVGPGADPDMEPVSNLTASRWVMDGGVLDNEPFAPVFDEIRTRTVERPVDRVVAYVVPYTGSEGDGRPETVSQRVGVLTAVPAAFNLPRDTGVVDDFARLRDLLNGVEVERGMARSLLRSAVARPTPVGPGGGAPDGLEAGNGPPSLEAIAAALYPFYRQRRVLGGLWEIRQLLASRPAVAVVDLRSPPEWELREPLPEVPWAPDHASPDVDPPGRWSWGFQAAFTLLRTWLAVVRDGLEDPDHAEDLGDAASAISRGLLELTAVQDAFVDELCRDAPPDAALERDDAIIRRGAGAFAATAGAGGQRLRAIVDAAAQSYIGAATSCPPSILDEIGGMPDDPALLVERHLHVEVVQRTFVPPTREAPAPRFRFLRVSTNADSPLDAEPRKAKLTGIQLHHFGAFLKRSWRANDWMWGRLDGTQHIVQMLATEERLRALTRGDERSLDDLAARLADGAASEVGELRATLGAIARAGPDDRIDDELAALRRTLVGLLHLEILREELPLLVQEVRRERRAGDVVSDHEDEWIRCLYKVGSKAEGPLDDDEAIRRGFRVCRIGDEKVEDVLATGVGQDGRREAVLSALRALDQDPKAPRQLHPVIDAVRVGVKTRGVALSAKAAVTRRVEGVRERVDDVRERVGGVRERVGGVLRRIRRFGRG